MDEKLPYICGYDHFFANKVMARGVVKFLIFDRFVDLLTFLKN